MPGNRITMSLSASAFAVLGAYDVEEVCQFDHDIAEVRLSEKVFLRVSVYVSKSVIISGFQLEVSNFWMGIFKSESGGNAIVEFVFNGHRVLCYYRVDTVVEVGILYVEVSLGTLAKTEAYLRPGLEEKLKSMEDSLRDVYSISLQYGGTPLFSKVPPTLPHLMAGMRVIWSSP